MEHRNEHRESGGQRSEISDAVIAVGRRVQQYLGSYEGGREEDTLDCLIYHVERLYYMLLTYDNLSSDVLEAVAKSLTLLQDIDMNTQLLSDIQPGTASPVSFVDHCCHVPRLCVHIYILE